MNSEVLRKILVAGAAVAALSAVAREKPKAAEREDEEVPGGLSDGWGGNSLKRIDPG